ncbi:efflux RND transporter periplasmic adaptor subunit [Aquabacterium sp. OR-4]|uniref:efflux RND transporter periplasmic adaptor subunit n=1 Tax=Aquabacterium sp. OR-4 TaxID=2978127 RepID=UPI0028CA6F46|nr:HlyD family efflux transporter periplasmic adaptor subunit [Aquabacterium sp. OR-4]MDT7838373.1 HlyD family efflux transporter periplasmic adaptor subunit [Aquabacterium sp. OR-4]
MSAAGQLPDAAEPATPQGAEAGHETVLPPEAVAQAAELQPALSAWRQRLGAAGLVCHGVALHSADAAWCAAFERPEGQVAVDEVWLEARGRVSPDSPVALARVAGGELLVATQLMLPDGRPGTVGALLAPPHNDRNLQLLLLSLGWLQLTLSAASLAHNQRAATLLQLLGHVGAQRGARAAAQDWINRTAAWARAQLPAQAMLALSLFECRFERVHWWVAADTSHAEAGSPAVMAASEVAQRALVESRQLDEGGYWALPLLEQGEVVAVLVAQHGQAALPELARLVLGTSATAAEPLLRHWRETQRPWLAYTWLALRRGLARLRGPGDLAWKAGALALLLGLLALVLVPVDDRVTANMVIEGRTRQLVTMPYEGFIREVMVRPGDRVQRQQLLLRLDDRELQLEAAKLRGDRDQAAGKLRQAMAERDAPAVALSGAELQGAEGQLALVEAKLARASLVAPLDGLVVSGDWVQQIGAPLELGKEVFEIASADGYRVVLHIPEHDIARVRNGQRGVLRLAGQPQQGHDFELSRITATASVQDGANGFRAEAAWLGVTPALSPGMQGVAKISVGRANLLTIWTRSSADWLRMKLWTYWI